MRGAVVKASLLVASAVVVCLAQIQVPAPISASPDAARAMTLTGQISVLRDAQPWALAAGDQVKVGEIVLTGPDGYGLFQVSDGSTFEVFPDSRVVFRKTPSNLKDLLDVWIGRVKVHIQRWGGQPNFNRVFTPTAVISVRGTTFYVEVEDGEATTLVLVDEGLVEVQHAHHPGVPKLLKAGEWLRVYRDAPLASTKIEKSTALRAAFRALADALYTSVGRGARIPGLGGGGTTVGGGTGSGGGSLPGDTGAGTPPPPPTLPGDTGTTSPTPPPPGS